MKKILPIIMVAVIVFTLSACKSKEYVDKVVTAPVTDESGKEVTDKDGNVVTETVPADEKSTSKTDDKTTEATSTTSATDKNNKQTTTKKQTSSKKESTAKKNESTKKSEATGKNETTTKKASANNSQTTTTKKETTTEATTKKPEKRKVTVTIYVPSVPEATLAKLTVRYKLEGDKKSTYYKFDDPSNQKNKLEYTMVKMDGKAVIKCDLGEFLGKATVRCDIDGYDLSDNLVKIGEYDNSAEIRPYSGIENMDMGEL